MSLLKEEKREQIERKRNLLLLISQYLTDYGLTETQAVLERESNLSSTQRQVCDNVDLDSIYLDYVSYYEMKFGKKPKISKICSFESTTNQQHQTKSGANKRKSFYRRVDSDAESAKFVPFESVKSPLQIVPLSSCEKLHDENEANDNFISFDSISQNQSMFMNRYDNFPSEWKDIVQLIYSAIVHKDFGIKWMDVKGHTDAKQILGEDLVMALDYRENFNRNIRPWKCILLHGPPGTGKTMLSKALYTETKSKITHFNITSSVLISKWRGESEKCIRVLFDMAKHHAPAVIFIDEIEGLTSKRDGNMDHEATKRFKNEFLTQLDSLDDSDPVIFVASTNIPWDIDAAFLRRFEKKIIIKLPNDEERIDILKLYVDEGDMKWSDMDLTRLIDLTKGFSGDDLRIVGKEATMANVRRTYKEKDKLKQIKHSLISLDDVMNAIQLVNPQPKDMLEKHIEWHRLHGTKARKP